MDYIAAGNVMVDKVKFLDGAESDIHIGGPAFFALSGIRLWTDSCKLVSGVGADFYDFYGQWLDDNHISRDGIKIKAEHTTMHLLDYRPDGTYGHKSIYGYENLGYLKTTPEDIGAQAKGTKGVYLAQNIDRIFWRKLAEQKEKCGFKFMWEIEMGSDFDGDAARILEHLPTADIVSLNIQEAARLYNLDVKDEAEILKRLEEWPIDMILFRVGKRGLYTIADGKHYFVPTITTEYDVDPTGCGNNSTGSALYAYCEGYDPIMVGIMANIASSYNVRQFGPYPKYTEEVTKEALALAHSLRESYHQ